MNDNNWPFDQTKNTAAVTTVNIIENEYPILKVVHYEDDHSWGFFCGATDNENDARIVSMEEIVNLDNSVLKISNLNPGQIAYRKDKNSDWIIK